MLISLDTETTGLDFSHGTHPFFVTIARDNGTVLSWEWRVDPHTRMPVIPECDLREIRGILIPGGVPNHAEEDDFQIVGQNIKFDIAALTTIIPDLPELLDYSRIHDTLLAGHILASNEPHTLTDMAVTYLGRDIEVYEKALKDAVVKARRLCHSNLRDWAIADKGRPDMPSITSSAFKADYWLPAAICRYARAQAKYYTPRDTVKDRSGRRKKVVHPWWFEYSSPTHEWNTVLSEYGNIDSPITLALWIGADSWHGMEAELHRRGLWKIYLERQKLIKICDRMGGPMARGITINGDRRCELETRYSSQSLEEESSCVRIAGDYSFPLTLPKSGSNASLTEFCFKVLKLPVISRTKENRTPSLDKNAIRDYLLMLEDGSPGKRFLHHLSNKRKLDTALSFLKGYSRFCRPFNSGVERGVEWYVLHPNLNPTGTATLRWSFSNPNSSNVCVDPQTEFLTDRGWVYAADLCDHHSVAQYWPHTGEIDFTTPVIQKSMFHGYMQHITTELHIDMLLTPNHRCLLRNRSTGEFFTRPANRFKSDCHHMCAGMYVGGDIHLEPAEVTWLCAVQADGSYHKVNGVIYGIRFAFRKLRKIERLRDCLNTLKLRYREKTSESGIVSFYVHCSNQLVRKTKEIMPDKVFNQWILGCDRETLDLLANEVFLWDGRSDTLNGYSSSDKRNADWVQILLCLSKRRADLRSREVETSYGSGIHHYIGVGEKDYSLTTNFNREEIPWDGMVYCVTVPSSFIVIRRNGLVSITGNSKQEDYNLRYCFGPAPGREWWSFDAKNIELRIPAYEAGEKEMVALFDNPDAPPYFGSNHLLNAHTLWPKLFEECTTPGIGVDGRVFKKLYASTWYQWVKNGDFAIAYSAGNATADASFRTPGAKEILDCRFRKMAELNTKYVRLAGIQGYVETLPDREVDPTHGYPLLCTRTDYGGVLPTVPLNYHVSGTAMWWTMRSMIKVESLLEDWRSDGFEAFLLLQVHDELVLDFPRSKCHPKKCPQRSNLWRAREIARLMASCGDCLIPRIPTPVGIEYHETSWDEGVTFSY